MCDKGKCRSCDTNDPKHSSCPKDCVREPRKDKSGSIANR
jgi:hypothetical protein